MAELEGAPWMDPQHRVDQRCMRNMGSADPWMAELGGAPWTDYQYKLGSSMNFRPLGLPQQAQQIGEPG